MKKDRRDFLRKAATATTGIGMFPTIIKASSMGLGSNLAPSDKITMILIGSGGRCNFVLESFLKMNDVQVIAACDVDDSQAAYTKKHVDDKYGNSDCRVYKDFREILESENADSALLALPDHWHAIIGCAVANKKIDVYGEKPLARTIAGGRAIVDAVQRNNIVWQMGSQQRSWEHFLKGAELVKNGRIGKVEYVEVGLPDGWHYYGNPPVQPVPEGLDWDTWLGPAPRVPYRGEVHGSWRWIMDYSGGQLTDWAGHHIDIAHLGLGLDRTGPVSVEGKGRANFDGIFNVPAVYDITCIYKNGIKIRIANQSKLEHGMGTVWYGSDGWLHVNRVGIWASDENILNGKPARDESPIDISGIPLSVTIDRKVTFDHARNFIDCVISRKETAAPADIGHRSISVALLGEIAMITGQKLEWDPDKEVFINNVQANRLLKRPYRAPWQFPG